MPEDPARANYDELVDRLSAVEAAQSEQAEAKDDMAEFHQAMRDFKARERAYPNLRAGDTFERNQARFRGWLRWRYPDRDERLAYLRAEVGRGR